jgi:hypothetical protein
VSVTASRWRIFISAKNLSSFLEANLSLDDRVEKPSPSALDNFRFIPNRLETFANIAGNLPGSFVSLGNPRAITQEDRCQNS